MTTTSAMMPALVVLKLSTSADSEDFAACMDNGINGCNKTMPTVWTMRYNSPCMVNMVNAVFSLTINLPIELLSVVLLDGCQPDAYRSSEYKGVL